MEINTKVTIGRPMGKNPIGNILLEDARFFGRPNFSGEKDIFKESKRRFTVLIPNENADELRALGWNVKTQIPTAEEEAKGFSVVSHLKVAVDENSSDVWISLAGNREKLSPETLGVVDRSWIEKMVMEIRAWEYDPEDRPGMYSARLVALEADLRLGMMEQRRAGLEP